MSSVRELTTLGICTSILFLGQVFLAVLPNIEIVSLLIILYTITFGKRVFLIIYAFVFLEGILYGFGIWWLSYCYIWSILAFVTVCYKKQTSPIFWAMLSGFFGLSFGLLCAIPYIFLSGFSAAIYYWLAGIPFDILHCVGNVVVCLILFRPLQYILHNHTL